MNENRLVNMKALYEIAQGLKSYIDATNDTHVTKDYVDEKLSEISSNTIITYDEAKEDLSIDTNFIDVIYEEETENLSILG